MLPGPAFEVELPAGAGQVQLVLASGSAERVVAAWAVWPDRPSRALVDGSMIEIEDGRGVPRTLRAYPVPGDVWRMRTTTARTARTWRLTDPAAHLSSARPA